MQKKTAKDFLGCQIWVEPADSAERVDALAGEASRAGLGWLRTFLIWPWIEAEPGRWDFRVYDDLFNACERHGLKIKATLTANSGPWHIGTPSLLHSHTGFLGRYQDPAIERYVESCVTRYAGHPALGQWILWNEPNGGGDRTDETLELWRKWLGEKYNGNIATLNRRWRTGYAGFGEAPFAGEVPHPVHQENTWRSYGPYLDDCAFRSRWLVTELDRIAQLVRRWDGKTPLCVNPTQSLESYAKHGLDMEAIDKVVDVVGATYHPAWNFTFAERSWFPAIMAAGVRKQAGHGSVKEVEVTEVQSGNTLNSSTKPSAVEPSELARFYLAGIFAGAQSVSGWLLNMRSYDFEAGDWGLLDDRDGPSPRTAMMRRVHNCLGRLLDRAGHWQPAPALAHVGFDPGAQAVELVDNQCNGVPGRLPDDSSHGAALLTALLSQRGIPSDIRSLGDMPENGEQGSMIVLSHVLAWEPEAAGKLLRFAENGGILVLDAACGRKNFDAAMHRPWPGGFGVAGLESAGLESNPAGYPVTLHGHPAGIWILTRMTPVFHPGGAWSAWKELRFAADDAPCVYERPYGAGKIILVNGIMGPSLVHGKGASFGIRYIFDKLCPNLAFPVRPIPGDTFAFALPNHCEHGELTAVLGESRQGRGGKLLRITAPTGSYEDLWSDETVHVPESGEIALPAEDGVVLLYRRG
jgi:beta-galactosidase